MLQNASIDSCHVARTNNNYYYSSLLSIQLGKRKKKNKKLSYCRETVRRESMPGIAEMDVEITTWLNDLQM